eukprot:Nk52_evm16s238 gene=Nk52_evmTU16s238
MKSRRRSLSTGGSNTLENRVCGKCQGVYHIAPSASPQHVKCPHCNTIIKVSPPGSVPDQSKRNSNTSSDSNNNTSSNRTTKKSGTGVNFGMFSSIFGGSKSKDKEKPKDAEQAPGKGQGQSSSSSKQTGDSQVRAPPGRVRSNSTNISRGRPEGAQGFVEGTCICCNTLLRFPLGSPKARCAICSTISSAPGAQIPDESAVYMAQTEGHMDLEKLSKLFAADEANGSKDYMETVTVLVKLFSCPQLLNFSFLKKDLPNNDLTSCDLTTCNVDMAMVRSFFSQCMAKLPHAAIDHLIKVCGETLSHHALVPIRYCETRYLLVLLQWPVLDNPNFYPFFSRLLGLLASLSNDWHHYIVHWFVLYGQPEFRRLIKLIHSFIHHRLFGEQTVRLLINPHRDWWVATATKVLALLNAANRIAEPSVVSYTMFYNSSLDHMDFVHDYDVWQSGFKGFSFCQYSFILSMQAKMAILEIDAQRQMAVEAQDALVSTLIRGVPTDPYLTIIIRRDHLIQDSLEQISKRRADLKKKIRVKFHGEAGIDAGGLTKEWFLLLVREIFNPYYGMFTEDEDSHFVWFSVSIVDSESEYYLIGVLMGLAIYNGIILDINFPPVLYKKLLGMPVTLMDVKVAMPAMGRGLQQLLDFDGDVENTFCRSFVMSVDVFGEVHDYPLVENGENKPITNANRSEYVSRSVDWILNTSIEKQYQALSHGFLSVCGGNALSLFRNEELELLCVGSSDMNFSELEQIVEYDGWLKSDKTVIHFWQIVKEWDIDMKKKFLLFLTGTDRVPCGGMKEMRFKLSKVGPDTGRFPFAHTCFNQLCIYDCKDKERLKSMLEYAILNSEGFGMK